MGDEEKTTVQEIDAVRKSVVGEQKNGGQMAAASPTSFGYKHKVPAYAQCFRTLEEVGSWRYQQHLLLQRPVNAATWRLPGWATKQSADQQVTALSQIACEADTK